MYKTLRPIYFKSYDSITKKWHEYSLKDSRNIPGRLLQNAQQYTGMFDYSSKRIYENDIVIFNNTIIGGSIYLGQVVWNMDQTMGSVGWGLQIIPNGRYLATDFLGEIKIISHACEFFK
jgi:hypothetical protein